jgi:hypothetical protein
VVSFGRQVAAMFVALVVVAMLALGPISLIGAQNAACEQVHTLRTTLVTILANGEKSLTTSTNPYYRSHPEARANALAQYQVDIKSLQAGSC